MRVSGELAIRAVNFMRSGGLKPDETIIHFDGKNQLIHLETFLGAWIASRSYDKLTGKPTNCTFNQRKKVR